VANRVNLFEKPTQQKKEPSRSELEESQNHQPRPSSTRSWTHLKCVRRWEADDQKSVKQSIKAIQFASISKGVKEISATINYNSNNKVFRYISDDANAHYQSPIVLCNMVVTTLVRLTKHQTGRMSTQYNPMQTSIQSSTTTQKRNSSSGLATPMTRGTRTTLCGRYPSCLQKSNLRKKTT
jgi:hypothetical protein